jgi:hypothetical protein
LLLLLLQLLAIIFGIMLTGECAAEERDGEDDSDVSASDSLARRLLIKSFQPVQHNRTRRKMWL